MKSFFDIVPFTESVSPANTITATVSSSETFVINSVPINDITYEWFLDGQKIEHETSSSLSRSTAELPAPSQQLMVNARYTSDMMRSGQPSDSFSWTVENTGMTPSQTPHWWLAANNLGVAPGDDQTDPDNDGQPSAAEYIAGTNPMEKSSVLQFSTVNIAPTGGVLEFVTVPGHRYRLEYATKLDDWLPVTGYENIDGSDGSVQYALPNTTDTSRFYRIVVWIQ